MPRMQPPKGYYTLTDTRKILNISNAMVREYVKKGKINYLLPEGREHGFYSKKDVDKLYNELNAILATNDEEEITEFKTASKEDLKGIARIANKIFSTQIDNDPPIPNWRYILLESNTESQYVLKKDNEIIGFATILPFKVNTDKIEKLLESETVSEANISKEDIEKFEKGKKVRLYIGAIGVDPDEDKSRKKYYGAKIAIGVINRLLNLGRRGVIIEDVTALGATHIGVRLLQTFGLHEIPARKPGNRAFTMNMKESGSHISMQYKQALKESKHTNLHTYKV